MSFLIFFFVWFRFLITFASVALRYIQKRLALYVHKFPGLNSMHTPTTTCLTPIAMPSPRASNIKMLLLLEGGERFGKRLVMLVLGVFGQTVMHWLVGSWTNSAIGRRNEGDFRTQGPWWS
jgi:hypothetical protein